MKVSIIDYDEKWAAIFEEEKALLQRLLNDVHVEIEHIGSTSVAGLAAKPIVDIMIGLEDLSIADQLIPKIIESNYTYIKAYESEMPDRRYFTRGLQNQDTHHLHMVAIGGEFWTRHLLFRNYLRVNSNARDEYMGLKKELAKRDWKDVNEYCEAKTAFIRRAEEAAVELFSMTNPNLQR